MIKSHFVTDALGICSAGVTRTIRQILPKSKKWNVKNEKEKKKDYRAGNENT